MPQSRSEVNTLATTSGAGKHFFTVFTILIASVCKHWFLQRTVGGEQIFKHNPDKKVKYENNCEYKCLCHSAAQHLNRHTSYVNHQEHSKLSLLILVLWRGGNLMSRPPAFRRQTSKTQTHVQALYLHYNYFHNSSDCSLLSHYSDVKRPNRALKQPIHTVVILMLYSEHRGGSNKVGDGYLYWLLRSTATLQIKCRGQSSFIFLP